MTLVSLSSNSLPALQRLMEVSTENEDWESVIKFAESIAAINPLLPDSHLAAAAAAEKLDRPELAVSALKALQDMKPIDPAALDFRIATALTELSQFESAKHHVLRALDEAPRYRDAHRLLLRLTEMHAQSDQANAADESSTTNEASAVTESE